MIISTAITGWTCELCAKDAILVAVTFGNVGNDDDDDNDDDGIAREDEEE